MINSARTYKLIGGFVKGTGSHAVCVAFAAAVLGAAAPALRADELAALESYADVLDLRAAPRAADEPAANVFFDQGAWRGYSLQSQQRSGFVGPFVLRADGGRWLSARFAEMEIGPAGGRQTYEITAARSRALPGRLTQHARIGEIDVQQTLIQADASTTLVRIELRSMQHRRITFAVRSGPRLDGGRYEASGAAVQAQVLGAPTVHTRMLGLDVLASVENDGGYRLAAKNELELTSNETLTLYLMETDAPASIPDEPAAAFERNASRWAGYVQRATRSVDARYRRIAVKAVQTLLANWRSARGDLKHDGLFPSYSNDDFHGFWAWDSWKHAAALARVAPELARDQIRAMFDYQNDAGMIADVIYQDSKQNNWRNTKPPLAAWAVWEVQRASPDRGFLAQMYPQLRGYHRWWYAERDHDRDGLAEYGSTDGTRIAAAWESGMDNAVRFDEARMLRNGEHAWSLNQESVDLNSFLYLEKLRLADIAQALGEPEEARRWRAEARALRDQVRKRMFNRDDGYFYDIAIDSGAPIRVMGAEGWSALWTGVATRSQARTVAARMLDPRKFATPMPFPTLAADHPEFSPVKGYWRGPVWIDQAYFAVAGLRNYSMARAADEMQHRLLHTAVGLLDAAPMYENYDPMTGQGVQSPNFSWSAAHYLLLLLARDDPTDG